VEEAAAIPLESDPLARLILAGELPWTLAYLFPELESCRSLAEDAGANLSSGMVELLDGEGVLTSRRLAILRPLLALWTRCGMLAREIDQHCFTVEARQQYAWFAQRAILLSRPDGAQLLSPGAEGAWRPELFEAALSLTSDREEEQLARAVLPLDAKRRPAAARPAGVMPAFHSEWAETALLRPEASRESPRLLASFGQRRLLAELCNRDAVLFSGDWWPQIEADGRRLEPAGDWEEVCWLSDADVDYLELEMSLTAGWRLQRQFALARKDEFLFVADAVLAPGPAGGETPPLRPAAIDYRCTVPLARGIAFSGEEETRDGLLAGKKKLALVLPLALPEWRTDRRIGSLETAPGGLELKMAGQGRALYAPLFFDLASRRFNKPRTWRTLTVAERLVIQRGDVAVGYRMQVGRQQWLFYRSLAKSANRTVLGQNLSSEFVAARFTRQGLTEELVSISSDA
jgi:hypothetical protein